MNKALNLVRTALHFIDEDNTKAQVSFGGKWYTFEFRKDTRSSDVLITCTRDYTTEYVYGLTLGEARAKAELIVRQWFC